MIPTKKNFDHQRYEVGLRSNKRLLFNDYVCHKSWLALVLVWWLTSRRNEASKKLCFCASCLGNSSIIKRDEYVIPTRLGGVFNWRWPSQKSCYWLEKETNVLKFRDLNGIALLLWVWLPLILKWSNDCVVALQVCYSHWRSRCVPISYSQKFVFQFD